MLADIDQKVLGSKEPGKCATGGWRSVVTAHYLPVDNARKPGSTIGWLGPVPAECWTALAEFAPTAANRHQVLRGAMEALTIRYAGPLSPEPQNSRFVDLLSAEGLTPRDECVFTSGLSYQICVEEADSLENQHTEGPDLTLVYLEGNTHCGWRFPEGAWDSSGIERFHDHFWSLLLEAIRRPNSAICELKISDDGERDTLLGRWAGLLNYEVEDQSTVSRFESIAKEYGGRTAIVHGNRNVSYKTLNEAANRLAHYLMYFSVRPSSVVAVCMPPSPEAVIAKLAIQKLGGVSLILDATEPAEKRSRTLENCGNPLCITLAPMQGANVVNLDADAEAIQSQSPMNPAVLIRPEHAAEIVLGSASAEGRSATLLLHRSILSNTREQGFMRTSFEDVIVLTGLPGTAQASFEFWSALLNGAKLVLPALDTKENVPFLGELVKKSKATRLLIPEGKLSQWLTSAPDALLAPETLIVGGAGELSEDLAALARHRKRGRLFHSYGNHEMGVLGLIKPLTISHTDTEIAPPRPSMAVYVLDGSGTLAPVGAVGELCIEGPGLAWGQLSECGATRQRFITKEFGDGCGGRLYRTGELVRWREGGRLERVGRAELLTNFDGVNLNLFAVERALRKAPNVRNCAVVVRQVAGHLNRLVAYVQLEQPIVNLRRVLRESLSETLPDHMLPVEFLPVRFLPADGSGNLDRASLSAPALGPDVSGAESDARAVESGAPLRRGPSASRPGLMALWKQALRKLV
jgi:non-ribosomal peptide synthetase component F